MVGIEDYLSKALRHLKAAERMTYIIFPLINEKKFLLKILDQIYFSLINLVRASILLEKEKPLKDEEENLKKLSKFKKHYEFNNTDLEIIQEIFKNYREHKKSAIEFPKKNKVIIMRDDLEIIKLDIKKIKKYFSVTKSLYISIKNKA